MAWNPVPHNDPATGPRHPNHFSGHIKRLGCEHGSKDAHNEVKRLIFQVVQIRRVTLLKLAVCETALPGAPVSSVNQVLRNIDAEHVRSEPCRRLCGRSIAASEIQNLEPFCEPQTLDQRLSALPHAPGNAREVAFFPKGLVWIHRVTLIYQIVFCHELEFLVQKRFDVIEDRNRGQSN
jgi:hypothetical protein